MSWYLAPALDRLRDEVNAKWPNRSKASDGTIGDASHSARTSDHNPNARGSVNAMDITKSGIDTDVLIAAAKKHPSVRYIIHNRRIMNRDIGNFRSRPYSGSNPHTQHVHISLYQRRSAEESNRSWGLGSASSSSAPSKPTEAGKLTVDGKWGKSTTRRLQEVLGTPVDGIVSAQSSAYKASNPGLLSGWDWRSKPGSSNVIAALQRKLGVNDDGRIGPDTIRALQRKLGTPVDGKVSNPSTMVKALQRNLNAGKVW